MNLYFQQINLKRHLTIITLVILAVLLGQGDRLEAQGTADPRVEAVFGDLSTEEKVGQLFLVTYMGSNIEPGSTVAALIKDYHVGGVVVLAENNNFTSSDGVPLQMVQIASGLQQLAADRQQSPPPDVPGGPEPVGPYVPLFIGLEHDGSAESHLQLKSGLTPLPSNLAIGATWDPAQAEAVGDVVGRELESVGVNLLLGPSADVVEIPQPFTTGDLAQRTFGGEPYWVSQMIMAYVHGIHTGSDSRVAVVVRHFPGHGGADRYASVEVPTIRRSLDQLIQIDLQPFFAVTGGAPDELSQADGLTTGHIKYLGFQGDNPRLPTRPISLDSQTLPVLLELEPISTWHDSGGLVVSDALGLRGIRRIYDPQETRFPNRRIAQDAFLAGNDMLYLGNYGTSEGTDESALIIDTIEFFVQAYESDPAFQARVDESVRRILSKKIELYGEFDLDSVLPPPEENEIWGQGTEVTRTVAQNALTLLAPGSPDLVVAPQSGENIVIFTDQRITRQCSTCPDQPTIPVDALQSGILRLYGPQATGLVNGDSISSYSFTSLLTFLDFGPQQEQASDEESTPEPDPLAVSLNRADWIVFVMLDVNPGIPASAAVKRFLAEVPVEPETRIVVLAMSAPYYLDSTEISKLTGYYALFGHTQSFIDLGARALFGQATLGGASPISVSGINYDILTATSPDTTQVLTIAFEIQRAETPATAEVTNQPEEDLTLTPASAEDLTPEVRLGDTLRLSTGVIFDNNGHPVPDGTPVEFLYDYGPEGIFTVSVITVDGIARSSRVIDREGRFEITARSLPGQRSITLVVDETIVPEPPDTTPAPTTTQMPEEEPTPVIEEEIALTPTDGEPPDPPSVTLGSWILVFLSLVGVSAGLYFTLSRVNDLNYALLVSLALLVGGFAGYNYYALQGPGSMGLQQLVSPNWGPIAAAWIGAVVAIVLALGLLRVRKVLARRSSGLLGRS